MIIILNKYPEAYYRIINIIGYKLLWDIKDFDYSKPLPEEIGDKLIEHKKNYPNAYMSQRVAKAS